MERSSSSFERAAGPDRSRPGLDEAALRDAVRQHHEMVFRIARGVLRHDQEAEDVAQESFLRLWREGAGLSGGRGVWKRWLARVAWNAALSRRKVEQRRLRRETSWSEAQPREVEMTHGDEVHSEVERAIEDLPEDLRIPIVLHFREGLKYREIAELLQRPIGTISKRMAMAKDRLKLRLERSGALAAAAAPEPLLRSLSASCPPGLESSILNRLGAEALFGSAATAAATGAQSSAQALAVGIGPKVAVAAVALVIAGGAWFGVSFIGSPSDGVAFATPSEVADVPAASEAAVVGTVREPVSSPVSDETAVADTVTIRGVVADARARPQPGVAVWIKQSPTGRFVARVTTDENGVYVAAGLKPFASAQDEDEILAALSQLRRQTGAVESQAQVDAPPASSISWRRKPGSYQTLTHSPDGLFVEVVVPGFAPERRTVRIFDETQTDIEVNVTLTRGALLGGQVTHGDRPVPDATVELVGALAARGAQRPIPGANALKLGAAVQRRSSDATGSFTFDSLPAGEYLLRADAPGFLPTEQIVRTGSSPVAVSLIPAATVTVEVRHRTAGLPIEGVALTLSHSGRRVASLTSDNQGRAQFADVPAGVYRIGVFRTDLPLLEREVAAVVGSSDVQVIEVDDGAELSGRIVVEQSLPMHRIAARVARLTPRSEFRHSAVDVQEDGSFHVEGLPPGSYEFAVYEHRGKGMPRRLLAIQQFELAQGERRTLEPRVTEFEPGLVEVRVSSPNSPIPSRATVTVARAQSRIQEAHKVGSAPYEFEVFPGDVTVRVSAPKYAPREVVVEGVTPGTLRSVDVELERLPIRRVSRLGGGETPRDLRRPVADLHGSSPPSDRETGRCFGRAGIRRPPLASGVLGRETSFRSLGAVRTLVGRHRGRSLHPPRFEPLNGRSA